MLEINFDRILNSHPSSQLRRLFYYAQTGEWVMINNDLIKIKIEATIDDNGERALISPKSLPQYFEKLYRNLHSVTSDEKLTFDTNHLSFTQRGETFDITLNRKQEFHSHATFNLLIEGRLKQLTLEIEIVNFDFAFYQSLDLKNLRTTIEQFRRYDSKLNEARQRAEKNMLELDHANEPLPVVNYYNLSRRPSSSVIPLPNNDLLYRKRTCCRLM